MKKALSSGKEIPIPADVEPKLIIMVMDLKKWLTNAMQQKRKRGKKDYYKTTRKGLFFILLYLV